MIKVYKKCEKSLDNPHGIVEIKSLDKPFLMCLSAQDMMEKSVFGIIKEGARSARVRTSDELAGGFKIDELDIDFLGVLYKREDIKDKKSDELVDKFFFPLFENKSLEEMKKQARKMNFFIYCNGVSDFIKIENKLHSKFLSLGLTEEESKSVLSQISLVAIATEINVSKITATTVVYKDVNDSEVFDYISKIGDKNMQSLGRETFISKFTKSVLTYTYNGTGNHELKEYFNDSTPVKSALSAIVSKLIENSIKNEHSKELIPISIDYLLPILRKNNSEFFSSESILSQLDESLDYGVSSRYSKEEHELLVKLDQAYKKLASTKRSLEMVTKECEEERSKKDSLIRGIKEKCSDVAFEQIVCANGLWNSQNNSHFNELKTDRQIREEYELLSEEKKIR